MERSGFLIGVLLLVLGCKNTEEKTVEVVDKTVTISTENWPPKTSLDPKVVDIVATWPEYGALSTSFDALYTIQNTEDLKLVLNDLAEKEKTLETSVFPKQFDLPEIRSRFKVFRTYFLLARGKLEYQEEDPEEPVIKAIEAYNDVGNQMRRVVRYTLDSLMLAPPQ